MSVRGRECGSAEANGGSATRRSVLRGALGLALAAPILAACGEPDQPAVPAAGPAPSATQPTAGSFPGVRLTVACTATTLAACTEAGTRWSAMTGATVAVQAIPYPQRTAQYASWVVSKSDSVDVLHAGVEPVTRFGGKLYLDLAPLLGDTSDIMPSALGQLARGGQLYGAPLYADLELFFYRTKDWPQAPAKTWDELYRSKRSCAISWHNNGVPFWLAFYNSTGGQLFTDDGSQVLFDTDSGRAAWQAIGRGLRSGFFDPASVAAAGGQDTWAVFGAGRATSHLSTARVDARAGDDPVARAGTSMSGVSVTTVPGLTSGTSGSAVIAEGLGVNRFSRNTDAAVSFVRYATGAAFGRQLVLGGSPLPPSRLSLCADRDIVARFPFVTALAKQASAPAGWPSDARWGAPFLAGLTNVARGVWTADQAHTETVAAVRSLIVAGLVS